MFWTSFMAWILYTILKCINTNWFTATKYQFLKQLWIYSLLRRCFSLLYRRLDFYWIWLWVTQLGFYKKSLKITKGGNQNPYIEEEQTTQWPKEKVQEDKQRSTKHTHKTKDRVTRTPLKTEGVFGCSGRISSSCSTSGTGRVTLLTNPMISHEWGKLIYYGLTKVFFINL